MTKNDIVLEISKETGLKQLDVKSIVQMTLEHIIGVLDKSGRVELRNFGVFEVRERKARKARNPRTGVGILVPPRRVVSFKPGKKMEKIIRGAHAIRHDSLVGALADAGKK